MTISKIIYHSKQNNRVVVYIPLLEMRWNMYQTIQGKTIDGEIKIRYQRTMIVENDQGRHLC